MKRSVTVAPCSYDYSQRRTASAGLSTLHPAVRKVTSLQQTDSMRSAGTGPRRTISVAMQQMEHLRRARTPPPRSSSALMPAPRSRNRSISPSPRYNSTQVTIDEDDSLTSGGDGDGGDGNRSRRRIPAFKQRSSEVYGDLYHPYRPDEEVSTSDDTSLVSSEDAEIQQIRKTQERSQRWMYETAHNPYNSSVGNASAFLLLICSWILIVITFPFSLCVCLKVIKEYERAVIFRLGRLVAGGARGPGIFFILPCIDSYRKVDLRVVSFDVPPQEILSKDSVTVSVDAVIYFRISNPVISVTKVNDAFFSTKLLAQTTLRNVLGMKTLSEMLAQRDVIAGIIERILDEGTDPWGVKVERVEVKDMRLPRELMRAMAAEAEASREAKARFVHAEGEKKASRALHDAADILASSPSAIQLRYLQTLRGIGAINNHTVIMPIPISVLRAFQRRANDFILQMKKAR